MQPKTILKHLSENKTVEYTVRRLRGYLYGDASLVFTPKDITIGEVNIAHKLKCFRFDEKPYNQARWHVTPTSKGNHELPN